MKAPTKVYYSYPVIHMPGQIIKFSKRVSTIRTLLFYWFFGIKSSKHTRRLTIKFFLLLKCHTNTGKVSNWLCKLFLKLPYLPTGRNFIMFSSTAKDSLKSNFNRRGITDQRYFVLVRPGIKKLLGRGGFRIIHKSPKLCPSNGFPLISLLHLCERNSLQ